MELAASLKSGETVGDRVMKVNHAGEHGAINIYRGQLLVCRLVIKTPSQPIRGVDMVVVVTAERMR